MHCSTEDNGVIIQINQLFVYSSNVANTVKSILLNIKWRVGPKPHQMMNWRKSATQFL